MKISASRSARRLTMSACAIAALTAAAPAAEAKPAAAELRVQSDQKTLAPGQSYLTDTTSISTDPSKPACNGSGKAKTVEGLTALGLLIDAAGVTSALQPLGITDEFDFGLLVCSIGGVEATDSAFWLYKVNHVAPEVGADQKEISAGDEVLWYLSNTATGRNTGDELALDAPVRVKPSTKFTVTVTAYDAAGKATPAAGAQVVYGQQRVTADAKGRAEVTSGSQPFKLRAVRRTDVASASRLVCVAKQLSVCSPVAPTTINGTADGDRIKGTRAPDLIRGHDGRDVIDARGGDIDFVRCGLGIDRALITGRDGVGRDCEFVNGKKRAPKPSSRR